MKTGYESKTLRTRVAHRARKTDRPPEPEPSSLQELAVPEHISEGSPEGPGRVAVIAAHGMGQQVPFQTIEDVTGAIVRGCAQADGTVEDEVVVRQVPFEKHFYPRAELVLRTKDGARREVHLYEAYWAPLAEGRITTWETFLFLVRAAMAGVQHAWHRQMKRHMFDDWQRFRIAGTSLAGFVLAMTTIAALGVMNAVIVAAVFARGINAAAAGWPSGALLFDLTADFGTWIVLTLLLGLVGVVLPAALRRPRAEGGFSTPPRLISSIGNWAARIITVLTSVTGLLVGYHVVRHLGDGSEAMWMGTVWERVLGRLASRGILVGHEFWIALVVWLGVALLSLVVRRFLLQYVGDVAIYVSGHRVNRFYETRHAIKKACADVARCVYQLKDGAAQCAYDRVVMVGHSLGSVVIYDILNLMLREDEHPGDASGVAKRTTGLVTFGSPLDKTAFVFRSEGAEDSLLRESLAESVQPLISSYAARPLRWTNLWSPHDWISGDLTFYDRDRFHDDDQNPKRVRNLEDPEATTPLLAHSEYWQGTLLARCLWEEVA